MKWFNGWLQHLWQREGVSRRAFLGGAGAMLALPLLESVTPSAVWAQATSEAPKRLLFYYVPNGIHMPLWTPAQEGNRWDLTTILEPLAPIKSKLSILSGLANEPARPEGAGDHAAGTGGFLTATHVTKTEGTDIYNGVSVDQLAAPVLGEGSRFPSLQLGVDGGGSVGNCDSGYSCAYVRNISWAGPRTPLAKTTNPQVVFDRLFAGSDQGLTAQERAKRQRYKASVLDYALEDVQALTRQASPRDAVKLDEYLTGVRELERRIDAANASPQCEVPDKPPSDPEFQDHIKLMSDLMALAFQCDLTRVITFMLGNAASSRPYSFLGVDQAHHELSHHQDQQSNFDKLTVIDRWEVAQLAYLLEKMSSIREVNGKSVLDNSLVFFSSEISDGNSHSHYNLPVILAGSQGGLIRPGRHIRYPNDEPIANLFLAMLASVGVEQPSFGDNSTRPLPDLT